MQAVIRLYREARRRKVFRTGALYIVGAWLALQVAALMFPGFGIPEAAIRALIWAAVLGFPVALAFGWLFDVGPGGIRRTLPAADGASAEARPLARRDYLLLAAFGAIALVLAFRAAQDVRETPIEAQSEAKARGGGERLENSIAVLPFANMSDDPGNEYFAAGVAEEILDRLSRVGGLNVIGRTSSFAFKGSDYGVDRISAILGVRYVLQGSVRKAGSQLRISTQLLDQEGRQVWSESFDRQLENVFEIQSEVASAVASTVASQVAPAPDTGHQPALEAYDHFLRGRELIHQRNSPRAQAELLKAVEIDPLFAEAHAELALAILLSEEGAEPVDRARRALDHATELRPRLLRAQAVEGLWLMQREPPDPVAAERVLRGVLAQDPNMSDALNWLTNVLSTQGRSEEARAVLERAARIDPLHAAIAANFAKQLMEDGRIAEAKRVFERVLAQPTPGPMVYFAAGDFYRSIGSLVGASAVLRQQALHEPTFSALFFLMQSVAALGDWELADALNDRLMAVPPEGPGIVYRGTILPGLKGDFALALERLREAYEEHGLSLPDLDAFDRVVAGGHLARARQFGEAIEMLEPVIDPDSPYDAPEANRSFSAPANLLAWAYLQTGERGKAARVLAGASSSCRKKPADGELFDGLTMHRCAEVELLLGNRAAAMDGLERAIEAGWREYYVRERDPIWAEIAADPRCRALLARVKADVDRQRAEVQQASPGPQFLAQLDEAIETRGAAAASGH